MDMSAAAYDEYAPEISLEEFEKFIDLPENQDKTFELIDGYISMMAGNTSFNHQRICGYISRKIGNYPEGKKCEVVQDINVYLYDEDNGKCKNVFQPDIMVGCDREKMTAMGYEGAPEFVAEVISKSTAWNDYSVKCKSYMDFGVKEYWIVDLTANQILVYRNGGENSPAIYRHTFADKVRIGVLEDLIIDFNEIRQIVD